MIHKLALSLADKFAVMEIIPYEQRRSYAYGFELMLSSLIGTALLIITSCIFGEPLLWAPYLIGYVLFRTNAGGYHARTHWLCITLFVSVYAGYLWTASSLTMVKPLVLICCTLSCLAVLLFAPVESPKNPLYPSQRMKRRKLSIMVSVVNLGLSCILSIIDFQGKSIVFSYFMGVTVATIFFVITALEQKMERRKQT